MNWYGKLIKFKEVNGHTIVPPSIGSLGHWCNKNRMEFRNGKLRKERVELLEKIDFEFEPMDSEWMRKYEILVQEVEKNGHARVVCSNKEIGTWINHQRLQRRSKR